MKYRTKRIVIFLLLGCVLAVVGVCIVIRMHGRSIDYGSDEIRLKRLKSLPYAFFTKDKADANKKGVTRYEKGRACEGYNRYHGRIYTMEGQLLYDSGASYLIPLKDETVILAYYDKPLIGRYRRGDNKPLWERNDFLMHHCITLSDRNTVLLITKETHRYRGRRVEWDVIVELSLDDGTLLSRWSTFDHRNTLKKFHDPHPLDIAPDGTENQEEPYDYYHLNWINVLPETKLGHDDYRFQKGHWLISLPHVNSIMILDRETKDVLWAWGPGEVEFQHTPEMMANGNLLIFDNGIQRKYSRVIELDPSRKEIKWNYCPGEEFYSKEWGAAERLPNGNTLITDSEKGRAVEVTHDGDVVWEYYCPYINRHGKRAKIYRMHRITDKNITRILSKLKLNKQAESG
ncbi:MAG: arylsulfotransferase family protein [Candidatus Omnitrophica bacterium]|nr:arylsulfotransferase family protein [Candidatus Omnitrophota bacterium]